MITMIDADEPFDIRACPIWAIPALGRVLRTPGVEILSFRVEGDFSPPDPDRAGIITVVVSEGSVITPGLYKGNVYKKHMNTPGWYPSLYLWSAS